MKKHFSYEKLIPAYLLVLTLILLCGAATSKAVTVITENLPVQRRTCIIIDAGHGGIDGGATSCTGVLESTLNLEFAQKLDALLHFLGIETKMIRNKDCSVATDGTTIAGKKLSDLKNRVNLVNKDNHAILISLHQNHFPNPRYSGAQVFYASAGKELGSMVQNTLAQVLGNKRPLKQATGIYLMEHIENPGILVECGFLSNPEEEARLRDPYYQKLLCSAIGCAVSRYLNCCGTS